MSFFSRTHERLLRKFIVNNVDFILIGVEPDAVDIITFSRGISIEDVFKNSIVKKLDELRIRIIDVP